MDPRLQRLLQNMGGGGGAGGRTPDVPAVDTAEKVHISSLALLKMLKHGQ
jgi:26S proteasome regulatory subunit N11